MRGVLSILIALCLALPVVAAPGDGTSPTSTLIEAQTRLVERTREYRESLEKVLAFQDAEVARAENQVQVRKDLFARGIVSRREMEQGEAALAAARDRAGETRKRMEEADALVGETLAAIELARMPKVAHTDLVVTETVIRYQSPVAPDAVDFATLETFFARRFGHALPVSARGQTLVHERMGLDHRRAIDVALHPDSEEGQALIEYLRLNHIPFLAFRRAVPGASTGAHVHIGPTSLALLPVRNTSR